MLILILKELLLPKICGARIRVEGGLHIKQLLSSLLSVLMFVKANPCFISAFRVLNFLS